MEKNSEGAQMKHRIPATIMLRLATGKMVLVTPHWWDKFLAGQENAISLDKYQYGSKSSHARGVARRVKVEPLYQDV
jgi:hypothetical protein